LWLDMLRMSRSPDSIRSHELGSPTTSDLLRDISATQAGSWARAGETNCAVHRAKTV
jgi:hypothetical protein